jgi:peroxiredoxin (alkyl hydroperoxide reductase subunit C)
MKPLESTDLLTLPADLPRPVDDGAAGHLQGMRVPSVQLPATNGEIVDLSAVAGLAVVFAYPRTGRPREVPLVPDWDSIPGARGCTPEACSFRDLRAEFEMQSAKIFGLSTQTTEYQREAVERLHLPFVLLSDSSLHLAHKLALPLHVIVGHILLKRLTWVQRDGVIEHVFYPVFPPDRAAHEVLEWLRKNESPES